MKKVWFTKILKTFGISLASIIGAIVLTGGVMYLVGALNPKKVELTNMNFAQSAYVLDGVTISDSGEVSTSNYDSSVKILPENEDATELDVSLFSSGNSIAKLVEINSKNEPNETNVGKVGTNITFDLTNSIGGTFELKADQDFLTTSTKIFVDLKLDSFNLTSSLNNDNSIYPGTKFTVSLNNCLPATYLRKPSTTNPEFYTIYGESYFNKTPLYFSSNESIATVNQLTGEVTVLDEGDFSIFAYVPRTYKLNANLPNREGYLDESQYFSALGSYCATQTVNFTSKSIEVGSITASTEVHNMNVFTTYKYSFNNAYASSDNELDLDIKIHVPTSTSFSDEDLIYRAKDIEIYEGFYNSETLTYSILSYKTNDDGERISEHFKISKTYQRYPYWEITPIDFYTSSQNYCLIAVINDDPDKVIDGNSQIDITETNKFHFGAVKVVNNYTPSALSLEKREYLVYLNADENISTGNGTIITKENGEAFDLNSLNFVISPNEASYKKLAFFVDASTTDGILVAKNLTELKPETDGENKGKILVSANKTGVAYIYAVVVKTQNNSLGETIYSGTNNDEIIEMSSRVRIELVISSKIKFENFNVNGASKTEETEEILTGFTITKGKSVSLTFNSTKDLSTAYSRGLFKVYTNAEANFDSEKIKSNIIKLGADSEITITGSASGETILYLELNGEIVKQFNILVVSDAVKSLTLSETNLSVDLDIEKSSSSKLVWNFNGAENSSENFEITISADENKEITNLSINCSVESDILNVETFADYKTLTLTPKKGYDGTITLNVSTQNSDNETIYSNVLQITINTPDIELTRNDYGNTVVLSGKTYEKVIDGEEYDILKTDETRKYIFEATTQVKNNDNEYESKNVQHLFTITANENEFFDNKFIAQNDSNTLTEIEISTLFGFKGTVYVVILPKYQLTTTTISEKGTEITLDNSVVSVIENYYDGNTIASKPTETSYSVEFSTIPTTDKVVGTKGKLDGNTYTKPTLIFEDGYDQIKVDVTIDDKTLTGVLNIELTANVALKTIGTELFAGQTVKLVDLLELDSASGYTLTIESVSNLPTGFEFNNDVLTIPDGFHNLTTNILVNVKVSDKNGSSLHTYENYSLTLNISYFELFLNEDYLLDDDSSGYDLYLISTETFDLKNLILSATKTSVNGIDDVMDENFEGNVKFYDKNGSEITNTEISSSYSGEIAAQIEIGEAIYCTKTINVYNSSNLITQKTIQIDSSTDKVITIYESITYSVSDLINITEKKYETKILNSAKILGCEETLSNSPVNNNLLTIKGYTGTEINIQFEILGQTVSLTYNYEKLFNLSESLTMYSNTEKIFLTKKTGITYNVQLQKDGKEFQNEYISISENKNNELILQVGAISETTEFNVSIQTLANGYEGGSSVITVMAYSVSITQNKTEIINGYEYELSNLITVSCGNDKATITYDGLTINNDKITINNDKIKTTYDDNITLEVNIKIGDFTLKTLTFNVICIEINESTHQSDFYVGQILDRATLLSYIYLTTGGQTDGRNVDKYKDLVSINTSTLDTFTHTIVEGTNDIPYELAGEAIIINLTGYPIGFTDGAGNKIKKSFDVYSGTTISEYVNAEYKVDNESHSLNHLLQFKVTSDEGKLIKNLASDFATTGKFTLKKECNGKITITVSVQGVASSVNIKFSVTTCSTVTNNNEDVKINVGDVEYELSQWAYFGTEENKEKTNYEFVNMVLSSTSASQYTIAKVQGIYVIEKDTVSAAKIENGKLILTSSLESMTITIYGYLDKEIEGLTSVSTKEEYVPIIIKLTKINVSMKSATGHEVTQKIVNNVQYNQIKDVTGSAVLLVVHDIDPNKSILIAQDSEGKSYYDFTSLKITNAFVCDENGQTLFTKGVSGSTFSETKITLPVMIMSGNKLAQQTITLEKTESGSDWQFSFNSTLINYVALTLECEVNGSQTSSINVLLAPKNTMEYVGTTITESNVETPLIILSKSTNSEYYSGIYAYYDLVKLGNVTELNNIELKISYTENSTTNYKEPARYDFDFKSVDDSKILTITSTDKSETGTDVKYYIIFKLDKTEYYFPLIIQEVNIATKYSTTETKIIDGEEKSVEVLHEINSTNPLELKNVLEGNNSLDLRDYIYFNESIKITAENDELASALLKRLSFTTVSNKDYSISKNGTLTINGSISGDVEVEFYVYGIKYILYLKGETITIKFDGDKNLQAGKTYYLYSDKDVNDIITTTISTSSGSGTTTEYLTFKNYNYVYGANTITEQSLFDITTKDNITTISYGGETLAVFTKTDDYYTISNLAGGFKFDVVTQYKETTNTTTITVSSVVITTNYVSPSIVGGREYQNILSNSTTNLSNLINCDITLTFTLCDYYNGVSITGSNLVVGVVNNEILIKIKAQAGEIYEYYYVRVIPETKITLANNNKTFNVISGDTIDLTDYIKVEKFSKLDSQNNPVYALDSSCYGSGINPLSYKVSENFNITINGDTFTFNAKVISFGTLECFIGENLDIKKIINAELNSNDITLTPTLSFSNDNNDISSNGVFRSVVANPSTIVKVLINNFELELTIKVKDFDLEPNYPANSYYKTTNNVLGRYVNAYATQTLNLSECVEIEKSYTNNLTFEVISSSLSSYSIDDVSNKIIYKINGTKIFEIDNGNKKLNVFSNLNDLSLENGELLVTLKCEVSSNTCKYCELNLRLMKTELILTKDSNNNEPTDSSTAYLIENKNLIKIVDDYYFNLKNVAQAKTSCSTDNIYLTDKLTFELQIGTGEIFSTSYIKLNKEDGEFLSKYDFQVQVSLGSDDNKISKLIYLTLNFYSNDVTASGSINDGVIIETTIGGYAFKGTSFSKTATDKTILSSGKIIAIYSNEYLVTFKKPDGATFDAYHISQDGKDIMWIKKDGTFEILISNYHNISLQIEAQNGGIIIKDTISFAINGSQTELKVTKDDIYEYINGIKYYVLYSDIASDADSSISGYTFEKEIVKDANFQIIENTTGESIVKYDDEKSTIIAKKVTKITYVQVEATESQSQTYVINFKIYPTKITKLYTEDFTLQSATEIEGSAMQQGLSYKTLYVYKSINTFNLNDYFALISNGETVGELNYAMVGPTYLDVDKEEFSLDKSNSICSLSEGVLTITNTETISYIGIKVYYGDLSDEFYFRIMPLKLEGTTTKTEYKNYSSINLQELFTLTAQSEKTLTGNELVTNASDIDLTKKLTFKITQGTRSTIVGTTLNISEINNGTIKIRAYYNNIAVGNELELTITNPTGKYLLNNIYYEEFFDETNEKSTDKSKRKYTITNFSKYEIEKIIVNGVEYTEKTKEKDGTTKFTTNNGVVTFFNDGNVESTDNNIIYVFLNKTGEKRYLKLNNYAISKSDGNYTYYENGAKKIGLLRYELVDSQGLLVENAIVTDETITASGISLNRITGELSGTSDIIYVKIYVKDDVYNTSEKYILIKSTEF